ncbi:MAG: nitroreductase family protein [Bacteroidales bacterium]
MSFLNLCEKRRSVREYADKKVTKADLLNILEAGRLAPSAVNYQPWKFYVVEKDEAISALHKAYPREWFLKVRQCIVICADTAAAWTRKGDSKNHAEIDASIAIDHMTLEAADSGIGTCWICNFDPQLCREALALTENQIPVAILSLGYPKDETVWSTPKKRKSLDEVVEWI